MRLPQTDNEFDRNRKGVWQKQKMGINQRGNDVDEILSVLAKGNILP